MRLRDCHTVIKTVTSWILKELLNSIVLIHLLYNKYNINIM